MITRTLHNVAIGALALSVGLGLAACSDDETNGSGSPSSTSDNTGGSGATGGTGSGAEGGTGGTGGGPACTTDICEAYGAAVPTVASDVTDAAATDPEFMDFFAPLVAQGQPAVDAFKASLASFISDAYGCSDGAYTGPTMAAAHAGMGITQQEYDDFVGLIAGVLADNGVPADDINDCFAPPLVDPAFSSTIVGK